MNISLYLYKHCHKNSNKHWLSLVPFSAVIDLKRPCFIFTAKHFLSFWSYLFYFWQSCQQKVLNLLSSNFHSTLPIWQPSFFYFNGGPLIFENVNMTHQLEIWHSEESERIWASFRRFGTHYLLMKWAHIYYDDTIIDIYGINKFIFELKTNLYYYVYNRAEFLSQHCLWESQQWLALYFTFDFVWSIFFLWLENFWFLVVKL